LALLFLGLIFYLGVNNIELSPIFFFDKTNQIKGTVTDTNWTYGVKGSYLQLVTYKYQVGDSLYSDKYKAGQMQGKQKIGDKLLIKYSVDKLQKNKIIGYYRNSRNSAKTIEKQNSNNFDQ
jgi:hypothetical protein